MIYYLALGANLGERLQALRQALFALSRAGRITGTSPVYETWPAGMNTDAPLFLNLAVEYHCRLTPFGLLSRIRRIEKELGRTPEQAHGYSRVIDIDILFADQLQIRSEELVIPHPRLTKRAFVLVPLADIAAEFNHPVKKKSVLELREELRSQNGEVFSGIIHTDLSV